MGWFRRTPPPAPPVEPWTGWSGGDLEAWLRQRVPYLDGHADTGRRRDEHLLTITPQPGVGRADTFVQASGSRGAPPLLQCTGARAFGGDLDLDAATDERMLTAGWQHPEPGDEWRFYVAWGEDGGDTDRVVRLLLAAVREVLGVEDGRVDIEDSPYGSTR